MNNKKVERSKEIRKLIGRLKVKVSKIETPKTVYSRKVKHKE